MTTVSSTSNSLSVELDGSETGELHDILTVHLKDFLDLFIRKNKEYGENAQTLGPRGQFSDMYRKMIKLRTGMWDGDEHLLTSESVDEILLDMIGHCFLTLRMRESARRDDLLANFKLEEGFTPEALEFLKGISEESGDLRVRICDILNASDEYDPILQNEWDGSKKGSPSRRPRVVDEDFDE